MIKGNSGTGNPFVTGGGGGGGVTSVAVTMPGIFAVAGSPITTNGTFVITIVNQGGNKIWASPADGSTGQPLFRVLVSADIPTVFSVGGLYKLDWGNSILYGASGVASINWAGRYVLDSASEVSIDWQNRTMQTTGGVVAVDWGNRILLDNASFNSVDWQNRLLKDLLGVTAIEWGNGNTITLSISGNLQGTFIGGSTPVFQLEGRERHPNMPTSDPGDGTNTLWYDTITRIVKMGT